VLAAFVVTSCTSQTGGTPAPADSADHSATAPPGLTCAAPTTARTVSCLEASLTKFWSSTIGHPVLDRVVLHPTAAEVPSNCRSALQLHTAFTCPTGGAVFVTAPYIEALSTKPSTEGAWYRFAATLGHEMGHVVQLAVHDPTIEKNRPTPAEGREIEQQADCLSGVWATAVGIDSKLFVTAASQVFDIIDSGFEEGTHGTPAVRLAAIRRGLAGRTAAACHLTVR
jgi:predicted metalloprotease